jgi:hypothetical protein
MVMKKKKKKKKRKGKEKDEKGWRKEGRNQNIKKKGEEVGMETSTFSKGETSETIQSIFFSFLLRKHIYPHDGWLRVVADLYQIKF